MHATGTDIEPGTRRRPRTLADDVSAAPRTRALALGALTLVAALATPCLAQFSTFDSEPVRPIALTPDGTRLLVTNIPDGYLEVFTADAELRHLESIPVGIDPVSVAAVADDEAWVVNHISDSVSVVDLSGRPGQVVRTLHVGDDPRDIVVASGRAFVTTAHRGQHLPRDWQPFTPGIGRADVWVFDVGAVAGGDATAEIVTLFGTTPRALAVSPDGTTVYAAIFRSGNRSTTVHEADVCDGGAGAQPCELHGETSAGGMPAPNQSADGAMGPETGIVVHQDAQTERWLDVLGRDWSAQVHFGLPDHDLFAIDATAWPPVVKDTWSTIGTILYAISVNPRTGAIYVANTEGRNDLRLPSLAPPGAQTLVGHLHESRVTVVGGDVAPRHLNPHIDYDQVPAADGVGERSIAIPAAIITSPDGTRVYVADYASPRIRSMDADALEAGQDLAQEARRYELSAAGVAGLVLHGPTDLLFAYTREDNGLSAIDVGAGVEVAHRVLPDTEPEAVRRGRAAFASAAIGSSNGESACASCHVFGDHDGLAWNLGDASGSVEPNPNPTSTGLDAGVAEPFHPIKGPMMTQTMRAIRGNGSLHWRGDRNAGVEGAPDLARAGFLEFADAAVDLMGAATAVDDPYIEDMAEYALSVRSRPNPIRALSRELTPEQASARAMYFDDGCVGCHKLDAGSGFFGTDGAVTDASPLARQFMKIPDLRDVYRKIGRFQVSRAFDEPGFHVLGDQVRGYGFMHDGSFGPLITDPKPFLLAYDSDIAPIVGQQVTVVPESDPAELALANLLRQRAAAGDCELMARAVVDGQPRSWLRGPDGLLSPDASAEAALTLEELYPALEGAPLTLTCVPLGEGRRRALDRDDDGVLNRDVHCHPLCGGDPGEIDAGSPGPAPSDAGSPGPAPSDAGLVDGPPPADAGAHSRDAGRTHSPALDGSAGTGDCACSIAGRGPATTHPPVALWLLWAMAWLRLTASGAARGRGLRLKRREGPHRARAASASAPSDWPVLAARAPQSRGRRRFRGRD